MNELQKTDLKYIWHPCSQMKDYEELPPIVIKRGKGLYLYDIEGNGYADVVSSWWCNLLGHGNETINAAIHAQLEKLEHVIFANFSHEPAIRLCEQLAEIVPNGLSKFFFTDNGSAAIEVAMKMSFQYHDQKGNLKKKKFMALSNAYHGETLGALSVSGVDLYAKVYEPILLEIIRIDGPDCYRCPFGKNKESCQAECFVNVEKAMVKHGAEICAFLVEPLVQAAAGMKIYPSIYLKKLRETCTKNEVHLIADEIAVGFGRTGTMFACEQANITPDMMCLSKGLTGGYMPMALVVTTNEVYNTFYADYSEGKAFMHSHTYCGNPLSCSSALAVLNVLKNEEILKKAAIRAIYLKEKIDKAFGNHPFVGDIRHIGLIFALELVMDKEKKEPFDPRKRIGYEIYKEALKMGVILRPLGNVLYFNPPLIIEEKDIDFVVDVCQKAIDKVLTKNYEKYPKFSLKL